MLPLQTCVLVMQCQRRLSIRRGLGQTMTLPDERTPGNVLLCDAVVQTPHGSGACLASDQLLSTGSAVLLAEDDKMEGAGCRVGRLSLRGGGLWFSRPTTPDEDRRELTPGCHHPGRRTRAPHVPIPPFTVVRLELVVISGGCRCMRRRLGLGGRKSGSIGTPPGAWGVWHGCWIGSP
jgi:hypothetical protein